MSDDTISLRTRIMVHYSLMYGDYKGAFETLSQEPAVKRIIDNDPVIHYSLLYGDYKGATARIFEKLGRFDMSHVMMYESPTDKKKKERRR